MKVLAAENNISYTANNACKIYIIKQVDLDKISTFENIYASLLKDATDANSLLNIKGDVVKSERKIQLTRLLSYISQNKELYQEIELDQFKVDCPTYKENGIKYEFDKFYFLKSLFELRNCPLIDFSKPAYIFQIEGQSMGGLANVVSFNTNFSVNGQSSAEVILNNKDFLYNFKNFGDKTKYNTHLKSYFDTNDIIIIRQQKRNNNQDSLLNSFKQSSIDYWTDPYISNEYDPFVTIFTGYINDVNNSFSFTNGQQTLTLACTGPSKKLTWTRIVTQQAPATKDSYSALIPISAYINPQTANEKNKTSIANDEVVQNVVVRTYSGLLNIPEIKQAYEEFTVAFDKANSVKSDLEITNLRDQIYKLQLAVNKKEATASQQKELENLRKQLTERTSKLKQEANTARDRYNKLIQANFLRFVEKTENGIEIKKHTFISSSIFGKLLPLFVINGTHQPAYQWTFQNWSSLFNSDYSTVYQFIKGIADNMQFNFYDDPYGVIHFEVPDMTLLHLHKESDPNNLSQITSFTETQNTENIANVQLAEAKYSYNVDLSFINTVIKDYRSIQQYGEKMMQPLSIVGITNINALRYAAKMRMTKYNRKAMSSIRISMNGQPTLQLGKYAYIKSLRKLFYIESYSHSYNAGGELTTSLNGTYTREILTEIVVGSSEKSKDNLSRLKKVYDKIMMSQATSQLNSSFNKQLSEAGNNEKVTELLNTLILPEPAELATWIYNLYKKNFNYPENDEDAKLEIAALYNQNNLRECYLDDFIWALPFDVNPYLIAEQIQEKEKEMNKQMAKTNKTKTKTKTNTSSNTYKEVFNKGDVIIKPAVDVAPMRLTGADTIKGVSTFDLNKITPISDKPLNTVQQAEVLNVQVSNYEPVFNTDDLVIK